MPNKLLEVGKLEVGKVFFPFKGMREGVKFDVADGGCIMRIIYNNPTNKEIMNIRKGEVKFGLIEREGILFVLVKFGSLNWMDFPYHIDLSIHLTQGLLEVTNDSGYSVQILLANGIDGMVKVMRLIAMPTRMSKKFKELADKQQGTIRPNYNSLINLIYSTYSTDDLVKLAEIYTYDSNEVKEHEKEEYSRNTYWVKKAKLTKHVVLGKKYHTELPEELKPFYCYVHDGGHSLICIFPEHINKKSRDNYLVPAPVKTVLRNGYIIKHDYLVCSIPYDDEIGLLTQTGDHEY